VAEDLTEIPSCDASAAETTALAFTTLDLSGREPLQITHPDLYLERLRARSGAGTQRMIESGAATPDSCGVEGGPGQR
jgi:hypothetical protein